MTLLRLFLFLSLLAFTQCRPCRMTSCGCDDDDPGFDTRLRVIEQIIAVSEAGKADSVDYYPYRQAPINYYITRHSPLAEVVPKPHWSFFQTANACTPPPSQATSYFRDIIVITEKVDTVGTHAWAAGDTVTAFFDFGIPGYLDSVSSFLATHDRLYPENRYQMLLNTRPFRQRQLKITVHLNMSDGVVFTFPNLAMRVY